MPLGGVRAIMDYKPGEHPLADVLVHYVKTYGDEADIYLRAISDYIGVDATYAWWEKEVGRDGDSALAIRKSSQKLDELQDAERRQTAIPAIYRMRGYQASEDEK
jgi:hypothetical protein